MAIIGEIGKRTGLIVSVMVITLVSMVIMLAKQDFFGGGSGITKVGSINGETITPIEFDRAMSDNTSQGDTRTSFERVEQTWGQFVNSKLIAQQCELLGITVSDKEMDDLYSGENVSPVVRQAFSNPQTREFDASQVKTIIDNVNKQGTPEQKEYLITLRKSVYEQQLSTKFTTLVSKALYVPSWLAQKEAVAGSTSLDLAYVAVPFAAVADDQVSVSDDDIKKYINEHAKEFDKDATVNIEYVSFDIRPSGADSSSVRDELSILKAGFSASKEDSLFVANEFGEPIPMGLSTKKTLAANPMVDTFFNAAVGTVVGPYVDGAKYALTKIVQRASIDSTKASHILFQYKTMEEKTAAKVQADSVQKEIESGRLTFEAAAMQFGTDGTKDKGGDLGFFAPGMMVKEFDDACKTAAQGKVFQATTQFGLHLIKVTARKSSGESGVRLATISRPIVPSKATSDGAYQAALDFVGNNRTLESFRKTAEDKKLGLKKANGLTDKAYQIQGLDKQNTARDIIKWAHKASKGEVSNKVFDFSNQELNYVNRYVAVVVTGKKSEGVPSVADIKEDILPTVRNIKKGEAIAAKIGSATDLSAISGMYAAQVDTAKAVMAANKYGSPLAQESKVMGAALKLSNGATSKPIVGKNGVYVVTLINRVEGTPPADVKMAQRQVGGRLVYSASSKALDALKKSAKITDNRSQIY